MNASQARKVVAAASGVATLCFAAAASAQSVVVQGSAQPAPTVVPAPAPQQPVVVNNQAPGVTAPQPQAVVAANGEVDTGGHWRPNRYLLMTGLILAGAPYIASVSVAATSSNGNDSTLYIPAFGPWLDLGQRGGCPGNGQSCGAEIGNKALLVGDGILQSVGVLEIVGSFMFPEVVHVATVETGKDTTVTFAPSKVGAGGYGMAAVGQF